MKRPYVLLLSSVFALLAACSDDGSPAAGHAARIELEPPGENCLEGGLRVTVGEEVRYACDGDPSELEIVRLPEGAEGNPCPGVALAVTLRGHEPSLTHVCEPLPIPAFERFASEATLRARGYWEDTCGCVMDADERNECEAAGATALRLMRYTTYCMREVFEVLGPTPEGSNVFEDFLHCARERFEMQSACYAESSNVRTCDGTPEATALIDCLEEAEDIDCSQFDPMTPEERAWSRSFEHYATLFDCEMEFLAAGGGGF